MSFIATINTPGYMPWNDEPPSFDTAREAWSYLTEQRDRAEDEGCDETCEDGPLCQWSNAADYTETRQNMALAGDETQERGGYLAGPEGHWVALGLEPDGTGSIVGDTPGYHGDHDLGLAYTVSFTQGEGTWREAEGELLEDYLAGRVTPIDVRETEHGVEIWMPDHDLPVSGPCRNCGLLPLDWDAIETTCEKREN